MRKVTLPFSTFSLLAIILALGCQAAAGQSKPDRPNTPPPTPEGKTPSEGAVAAVDPNTFLIGAEDVLFIRTWREPDFTFLAVVRPDGKITVPLVGEPQAAGQTPIQLTKTITEMLTKYINNPEVNVFVQEVRSKKYYIDGEVRKPGSFPLVGRVTVLEALSNAGGFQEFANPKKIRILRGSQNIKFNYNEVTHGKHMEQNIFLESGDHIIVP